MDFLLLLLLVFFSFFYSVQWTLWIWIFFCFFSSLKFCNYINNKSVIEFQMICCRRQKNCRWSVVEDEEFIWCVIDSSPLYIVFYKVFLLRAVYISSKIFSASKNSSKLYADHQRFHQSCMLIIKNLMFPAYHLFHERLRVMLLLFFVIWF